VELLELVTATLLLDVDVTPAAGLVLLVTVYGGGPTAFGLNPVTAPANETADAMW
jgi:hypothetical protein